MNVTHKAVLVALAGAVLAAGCALRGESRGAATTQTKERWGATTLPEGIEITNDTRTGYAPANGLRIYYEIHGITDDTSPPLVLIHGGGSTIETSFGNVLPSLAKTRQIIASEQQGHGHTADIADRPFTFEQSADDTADLLRYLKIRTADFFGYSNGGNIALQMGIRHPHLVRKLVVASAMVARDGLYAEFWESM